MEDIKTIIYIGLFIFFIILVMELTQITKKFINYIKNKFKK